MKTTVPAVEGLFTMDLDEPHLIGGKGRTRDSYFFPKALAGSDPACLGDERQEVLLSRRGKVWSYTTMEYAPPPPFVVTSEPFEPFIVAAVRLEKESLVILGQVVDGVALGDLAVGTEMEVVLDTLHEDDEHEYLTWKWRPVDG